jgi:hypothetical protein
LRILEKSYQYSIRGIRLYCGNYLDKKTRIC